MTRLVRDLVSFAACGGFVAMVWVAAFSVAPL
jgi:hypothetical protein